MAPEFAALLLSAPEDQRRGRVFMLPGMANAKCTAASLRKAAENAGANTFVNTSVESLLESKSRKAATHC